MKKVLYLFIALFMMLPLGAQAQYDFGPYNEVLNDAIPENLMRLIVAIDNDIEVIQKDAETKYKDLELRLYELYEPRRNAITNLHPEIWENDNQFVERQRALFESLETEYKSELEGIKNGIVSSHQIQLNSYLETKKEALAKLEAFRNETDSIQIESLGYDRNSRVWSFTMTFRGESFSIEELPFTVVFQPIGSIDEEKYKFEIISFDNAVATNSLQPTLKWNFIYDEEQKTFVLHLSDFSVVNPINGKTYKSDELSDIFVKAYQLSGDEINGILIKEQEILNWDSMNPREHPNKLYVYTRIGSLFNSLVTTFEQKNNTDVVFDYYESDEELFAKMMASGNSTYDIILASSDYVSIMKELGLLQIIDLSKIPNRKYIAEEISDLLDYDPGMNFSIPFSISPSGIAINSRMVNLAEIGWDIFSNPKYRYRMTMFDDMREVFGSALTSLGFSVNTKNVEEIEKAGNLILSKWKPNVLQFVGNAGYLMASGDVWIAQTRFEDIVEKLEEDELDYIDFYLPKEGGTMNLLSLCVPTGANNYEFALKFIDFIHDPRIYAQYVDQYRLPSIVNIDADKYRTTHPKYTLNELKNFEVTKDIIEVLRQYNERWEPIRYLY